MSVSEFCCCCCSDPSYRKLPFFVCRKSVSFLSILQTGFLFWSEPNLVVLAWESQLSNFIGLNVYRTLSLMSLFLCHSFSPYSPCFTFNLYWWDHFELNESLPFSVLGVQSLSWIIIVILNSSWCQFLFYFYIYIILCY